MKHSRNSVATSLVISHLLFGCILPGGEDESGPGSASAATTGSVTSSGSSSPGTGTETATATTTSDDGSSGDSSTTADDSSSDDGSSTGTADECFAQAPGDHEVLWVQDFEDGPGDWSVEGGVWQLGEPTAPFGPDAHGGNNVMSTGLDGDYPDGFQVARLVSPEFMVPSSSDNPQLRLWQWFDFTPDDRGDIQIRVDGGPWQNLAVGAGLVKDNSVSWTQQLIPLGSFEDRPIQVAFYFHSGNSNTNGTSVGWYIDDVSLETGPMTVECAEGFESGFGDWSIEGGVWELGAPTAALGPDPEGGVNVMGTRLDGDYPDGFQNARLVSPEYIVPSASDNPQVRLWQWFDFTPDDRGDIQIRVDGGPWQNLPNNAGLVQDSSGSWLQQTIPLGDFENRPIQVAFYFGSPVEFVGGSRAIA